jgi:hypothetical protein
MEQVCEASRGTTGRKKLKREKFLRFQVPWPTESDMVDAVNSLERVYHTSRQAVEVIGKQKTLLKDLPVCLASALYNQDAAAAVDL